MLKHSINFAVALLTFAVGGGLTLLRKPTNHPIPSSATLSVVQSPAADVKPTRTYHSQFNASGRAGKHPACFGALSSSDGMTFSRTNIYFASPNQARQELQQRLRKAVEIVSRQAILDARGRVIGEEAVATFPPYNKQLLVSAALIVVEGANFLSIESSSLRNITEYKEDHHPLAFN